MFKFLKRASSLLNELTRTVTNLSDAVHELKWKSLPRRLDEMSRQIKFIEDSTDRIYILFKEYIESKEISEINKLRVENKTLHDCISMLKEQQDGEKSKTAEKTKQPVLRSKQP